MDIWIAGLSTDPMDPWQGDLFCTTQRHLAFAWLVGALMDYDGSDPYITEVGKALDTNAPGIVVSWHAEDGNNEDDVKGFVIQQTLVDP